MAFYLLIVVNTASACPEYFTGEEFAWESCVQGYQDWCDVDYDTHATQSCTCTSGEGQFVCTDNCGDQPHKVSGMCVACNAGYFFGYIPSGVSTSTITADCPYNDGQTCSCVLTTHTPSTSSAESSKTYPIYSVCNFNANNDAQPRNMQDYDNDGYSCNPCPPGTWSVAGNTVCTPCPTGTYTDQWGSSPCKICPAGHISASSGSTTCVACPAGTNQTTATECSPCQAGYYSPSASTECFNCAPGTFSEEGQGGCTDAQIGWYVAYTHNVRSSCPYLTFIS